MGSNMFKSKLNFKITFFFVINSTSVSNIKGILMSFPEFPFIHFQRQKFVFRCGKFSKRSHFGTQWKHRAGGGSNNNSSLRVSLSTALDSSSSVSWSRDCVLFHASSSHFAYSLLLYVFPPHFPTIWPVRQSGTAIYIRVVSSCYFTMSCGRSTQLFFRLLRLFYNYNFGRERDNANKMDDVFSWPAMHNYEQYQKISLVFRIA